MPNIMQFIINASGLYSPLYLGQFIVKDVKPSPEGENVKVKVKVRVNINGILTISSASLVLKQDASEQDANELENAGSDAMETESQKNEANGSANEQQGQTENSQENHISNEVRNMSD
jgi:mannitol-specific phosphotransferase system IIBC component